MQDDPCLRLQYEIKLYLSVTICSIEVRKKKLKMSLDFHEFLISDEANVLEVSELSEFVKGQILGFGTVLVPTQFVRFLFGLNRFSFTDRFYLMILNNNKEPTTIQSFKSWKESITDNDVFYLNIDQTLVYDNFYSDFGPLNLSMVYHYISVVREKFKVSNSKTSLIILITFTTVINDHS